MAAAGRKENQRNSPKKPNAFIYAIAAFFAKVYLRLCFGARYDIKAIKGLRGPFIGIGNHQCNLDFLSTASALSPNKSNYVVTTFFFNNKLLNFLLGIVAAIKKKQYVADISTTRDILRAVQNGQNVFIFPEGQVSICGIENDFDDAIGKLVKKLGVPVVNVKLRGGHLSYPKWSRKRHYPARMDITAELLLTPEQIKDMTADEIFAAIRAGIAYNEFDWQRSVMIPAKKDRFTEGLQNVLYTCPHCRAEFSIEPHGTRLTCAACGYEVALNRYGFFEQSDPKWDVVFDNEADWFLMQRDIIREQVKNGELPFETDCKLYSVEYGSGGYHLRGTGRLTLGLDGIRYSGTRDGAAFETLFPVDRQTDVTHNTGIWGIDFLGDDTNYGLAPDDSRKMMKLVELYREIRRLRDETR